MFTLCMSCSGHMSLGHCVRKISNSALRLVYFTVDVRTRRMSLTGRSTHACSNLTHALNTSLDDKESIIKTKNKDIDKIGRPPM